MTGWPTVKILTVLGARPQFIKAASVTRVLRARGWSEIIVHTGQHYDDRMSAVFFRELDLPEPDINLKVGSGTHAWQTAQMLARLEPIIESASPDVVLLYGDTNSTLAGALAACKLGVLVVHIEAGMRSFNRRQPEEHNRIVTDHLSDVLFCATQTAMKNLTREGLEGRAYLVGDTMLDALLHYIPMAASRSSILDELGLTPQQYVFATAHRSYNVDDPDQLAAIVAALQSIEGEVIFPVHPRTRARLEAAGIVVDSQERGLRIVEPCGYLDALQLERHARAIVTDSGGVQKEAYMLAVPCIVIRPETEWPETLSDVWGQLADVRDPGFADLIAACQPLVPPLPAIFGDGQASGHIVDRLAEAIASSRSIPPPREP